ncbi:glycosyltransferase family 4 protein [Aquisalimonas asiatica]|uniref:Glycosyltransferase involved in cell wall bisynthesis n=1 Tax=Aquisalimonas asiatica TaxID=406100 RepID=A0A1H8SPV8_9GAMM|nr:glycosyltransferase family 4 protein [Aquisalimonas asiatica]SEO80364.1 Glycosyltransferase involved in cell wall bisynthesis [Aquisalimonas asiatica]
MEGDLHIGCSEKVLIVTDNNVETVGGEQESIKIIARNLSDELGVAVLHPGESKGDVGFCCIGVGTRTRIKALLRRPVELAAYVVKLLRYLRGTEAKVVHTQAQASLFLIGFAIKLRLIPKRFTFVHTDRGTYSKYSAPVRALFRVSLSVVDTLVTTTHRNRHLWEDALLGVRSGPEYAVIENAVSNDGAEVPRQDGRRGEITIGFAGRYCGWKNWPLALEIGRGVLADEALKADVRMAIGCVDERDREAAERFLSDARAVLGNALSAHVNVPHEEMAEFFRSIDILVMTSKPGTESFGRTAIEAMSEGCVVLSTDSGGPSEVLDDAGCILAEPDEFLEKIKFYAMDVEARVAKGRENQQRVQELYSADSNVAKHRALYEAAIARWRDVCSAGLKG